MKYMCTILPFAISLERWGRRSSTFAFCVSVFCAQMPQDIGKELEWILDELRSSTPERISKVCFGMRTESMHLLTVLF